MPIANELMDARREASGHAPYGRSSSDEPTGALDALFALIALATIYAAYRFLPPAAAHLWSLLSLVWVQIALTTSAIAVSLGLFALRVKHRVRYAIIELCFGLVSTWEAASLVKADSGKWPLIVAAVYLIVRGCDNFRIGLQERQVHLAAASLSAENGEQDGADQPATAPDSKSEGGSKPKAESEGRSP